VLAQNRLLLERVQELEGRLAKDSHNSSKAPSSDGLGRKTKSLRKRSGRKPGGQLGHRDETLRLVAVPDRVVEHRPGACAHCWAPLEGGEPVVRGVSIGMSGHPPGLGGGSKGPRMAHSRSLRSAG
jgi:Family of unknown function (DUF6444)